MNQTHPYSPAAIADALDATALGKTFDGNALRMALDFSILSADDRSVVNRWAGGRQETLDHLRLQEVSIKIRRASIDAVVYSGIRAGMAWHVEPDLDGANIVIAGDGIRSKIATLRDSWLCEEHGGSATENARRIAACVNFCANIPTGALEMLRLEEVIPRPTQELVLASMRHNFTVETEGDINDPSELSVVQASIPEDQLDQLLRTPPGVVYAKNQDGILIELMLDMDHDSLIARGVELTPEGAVYLSVSDDLADNARHKP